LTLLRASEKLATILSNPQGTFSIHPRRWVSSLSCRENLELAKPVILQVFKTQHFEGANIKREFQLQMKPWFICKSNLQGNFLSESL
jgi:hypothetical protein